MVMLGRNPNLLCDVVFVGEGVVPFPFLLFIGIQLL